MHFVSIIFLVFVFLNDARYYRVTLSCFTKFLHCSLKSMVQPAGERFPPVGVR